MDKQNNSVQVLLDTDISSLAAHGKKKRSKLIYLIIAVVVIAAIGVTLFIVLKDNKQPYEYFNWGTSRVDVIATLENMELEFGFDVTGESGSTDVVYKESNFFGLEGWVRFIFDDNLCLNQVIVYGHYDTDEELSLMSNSMKSKYGSPYYESDNKDDEYISVRAMNIDWTTGNSEVSLFVLSDMYSFTLSPLSEDSTAV